MLENLRVNNFRSHEKTEINLHSGLNVFLGEVGAGKTLSGLIKKINRDVSVYNVNDCSSLEKTVSEVKNA